MKRERFDNFFTKITFMFLEPEDTEGKWQQFCWMFSEMITAKMALVMS